MTRRQWQHQLLQVVPQAERSLGTQHLPQRPHIEGYGLQDQLIMGACENTEARTSFEITGATISWTVHSSRSVGSLSMTSHQNLATFYRKPGTFYRNAPKLGETFRIPIKHIFLKRSVS
jgi:hypothetical protein